MCGPVAEYYGEIVSRYTLKQAITDKVLTPYMYYPRLVELTETEADEFVELSEQIGRLMARQDGTKGVGSNPQLTALLMRRARLVGSAANKMTALDAALEGVKSLLTNPATRHLPPPIESPMQTMESQAESARYKFRAEVS